MCKITISVNPLALPNITQKFGNDAMATNLTFADLCFQTTTLEKKCFPCFHKIFFVIEWYCIITTKDEFDYFCLLLTRIAEQKCNLHRHRGAFEEIFWDFRLGLLLRTGGGHVPQPSLRRSHSSVEVHHRHQRTLSHFYSTSQRICISPCEKKKVSEP